MRTFILGLVLGLAVGMLGFYFADPAADSGARSSRQNAESKKGEFSRAELTAAAQSHIRSIEKDDHFFYQAGGYLRERPSSAVIAMTSERFRKNPDSGHMWNPLRGLREASTPEARALLQEIATDATRGHTRNQAQQHLDYLKEMEDQLKEGLMPGED